MGKSDKTAPTPTNLNMAGNGCEEFATVTQGECYIGLPKELEGATLVSQGCRIKKVLFVNANIHALGLYVDKADAPADLAELQNKKSFKLLYGFCRDLGHGKISDALEDAVKDVVADKTKRSGISHSFAGLMPKDGLSTNQLVLLDVAWNGDECVIKSSTRKKDAEGNTDVGEVKGADAKALAPVILKIYMDGKKVKEFDQRANAGLKALKEG